MRNPKILIATAGVVGVAVFAAGCGNSTSASTNKPANASATPSAAATASTAASAIQGTLDEWSVRTSSAKAKAGKVTFTVKNDGKVHHEMVVVPIASGSGIQSLAGATGEASEDGSPGEVDGIDPGQTRSVTLDLKPGTYVLLCNEPGHFAGGMATTFTVS